MLEGPNSPFGMALIGNEFYVATADAIIRFPYSAGDTQHQSSVGVKVVDLPAGINHHWTKNLLASRDGKHLYVTVGSNSNVGRTAWRRKKVARHLGSRSEGRDEAADRQWTAQPERMVGAEDGVLWTVVNERDELGSDLVPDYLTSVVEGGFYGWPYSYWGRHVDTRVEPPRPDLVARAIKPDYALGSHVAPLGLATSVGAKLPPTYSSGMFIGEHGSWNRRPLSGYAVVFVPFRNGKPAGMPTEVLTGFVNAEGEAYGRPVGVTVDKAGGLLVADDVGNTIWRVTSAGKLKGVMPRT